MNFNTIDQALKELKKGNMIIVVDDTTRENEGDLVCAAEKITPKKVNFMIKEGGGLVVVPMLAQRLDELQLPLMVEDAKNTEVTKCRFTISVDLKKETSTGISAYDRSATIKALLNPKYKAQDFARPGHIFPLRCHDGGVLKRDGHTEASIDLMNIAGLQPAAVMCEMINKEGKMARRPELFRFAQKHKLTIVSINDLVAFRLREPILERGTSAQLPTRHGTFTIIPFTENGKDHVALIKGNPRRQGVLVRLHSECLTGDLLGSLRCDCGAQLRCALDKISKHGGILLYLRQEGRGLGLANKIKAYSLQDKGYDTVEANELLGFDADLRDYHIAAQMLKELGVKSIRLLTNNPQKINDMKRYNINVVSREPIEITSNHINRRYLGTKKAKLGHLLTKI